MNDLSELKILIIQNTFYHFETTISLYSSLKRLNPLDLKIIQITNNHTDQVSFLNKYNISYIHNHAEMNQFGYDIAFVVSAYPNPHVGLNNSVPEIDHPIIHFYKNKTIYVCHRFNNEQDYLLNPIIKKYNSLSLSPLSQKIGLDFFYPIEYDIATNLQYQNIFCIQGHFELKNRKFHESIFNCNDRFELNIIGTTIDNLIRNHCGNHKYFHNLNEIDFYNVLNHCKFLFPMIDDEIKSSTYIKQRFSSNFNHAMALEKPIFAHESFENVYEIPGIYYNDTNIDHKFEEVINISNDTYINLINQFSLIKNKYKIHNVNILSKKILSILS